MTPNLIVYRYGDSSVPPEYHRSFSIEIHPKFIRLIVDSYGKILTKKKYRSKPQVFDEVLDTFKKAKIRKQTETDSGGCTGGVTEYVYLLSDEGEIFSGYIYHCQGEWGDMTGDMGLFAGKVKSLVPKLHKYTLT